MSRPYQHPSFNTSNSSSPLSPLPRGETPVSFRTNVNRAKTRRWVEAKKYSYDGDDWGEDEYGEYEYDDNQTPPPDTQEEPATVSQSSGQNILGTTRAPVVSADSSHAMDQAPNTSPEDPSASIMRPVDIYKRMREEQRVRQQNPNQLAPNESTAAVDAPANPPPPPSNEPTESRDPIPHQDGISTSVEKGDPVASSDDTPLAANEAPTISLPDVKRLSGFNPSMFTQSEDGSQNDPESAPEPHQLQHVPSAGFRSAVNQAFDVPETPSSTIASVGRSNSDSTTCISPIISHHGPNEDKTPTIEEELSESTGTPTEGHIVFKPGHRRDLSLPSPGNSPSRKPVITTSDASATSVLAQVSAETPSDSPQDTLTSSQQEQQEVPPEDPIRPPTDMLELDLPAPLNVQTNVPTESPVTAPKDSVPVIIPSMSTDNSPHDTENDRLRKEIIRSLSRENTPSDQQDQDTPPQTSRQDSLIPSEYERYWGEQQPGSPQDQAPIASTFNPPQPTSVIHSGEPPAPAQKQNRAPKLQRRFSWEASSGDGDDDDDLNSTPVAQPLSPPAAPMPGQFPLSQESIHQEPTIEATRHSFDTTEDKEVDDNSGFDKPNLTIVPPSTSDSISISSSGHVQETPRSLHTETSAHLEDKYPVTNDERPSEPPTSTPSTSLPSGLLGFKDILGIQSSEERVKAFNRTRDQFAAIDTGLNHWIQVTIQAHPEYSDVVERSSKIAAGDPKPSIPRAKFPKLSSLGNFTSSHQDGSTLSGHVRRPSAALGSMKQQVGKDLLHTAGVLGGQAGKAAKGLFSKGRNKLKGSGGTEKGFQSMRGYHRPVRLSDLQPDAESGIDLEDHQSSAAPPGGKSDPRDLHSTLVSRPWTTNQSDNPFPTTTTTKTGEEVFVQHAAADSDPSTGEQMAQSQRQSHEPFDLAPAGAYSSQIDDQQHRATGDSDSIQEQGEHGQHRRSPSNNNNDSAGCMGAEQLGAKPHETATASRGHGGFQDDDKNNNEQNGAIPHASNNDNNHNDNTAHSLPLGKRPSPPQLQSELSGDFSSHNRWSSPPVIVTTAAAHRRGSSRSHLALRQLPSVSSLGMQENDLGPLPPLSQKLAENNTSQVSLPSDVGDNQARNLGGIFPARALGDRTSLGDNPSRLFRSQSPLAPREAPSSTRPQSTSFIQLQHDWSRRPEQISSSRDTASHRSYSSPMERLKNVGHFRRISMGSTQSEPKAAQPPKKASKLTGLFGRIHQKKLSGSFERPKSTADEITVSPRPISRFTQSSVSLFDNQGRRPGSIKDGRNVPIGQRPPAEGYFARESPESFTLIQTQEPVARKDRARLSFTSPIDHGRLSPQSPQYLPTSSPQHQRNISSPRLTSPLPSPVPRTPPSRGRPQERTYAQDLHLRSRSPKAFAPRPEERDLPNNDTTDPAFNLGTFRTNPRTSRIGDQELPWKITIPGELDESAGDTSTTWQQETTEGVLSCSGLPTYQEDAEENGQSNNSQYPRDEKQDPSTSVSTTTTTPTPALNLNDNNPNPYNSPPPPPEHPHRSGARAINTFNTPIELPVRTDDDSSEEIMMSSTAYPGQEWRPLGFSEWDHQ